jgi:hypothetical protein
VLLRENRDESLFRIATSLPFLSFILLQNVPRTTAKRKFHVKMLIKPAVAANIHKRASMYLFLLWSIAGTFAAIFHIFLINGTKKSCFV